MVDPEVDLRARIRDRPGCVPEAAGRQDGEPWGMTNDIYSDSTTTTRKLRRSRSDRMVAGVCGGFAKLLGMDAALLRILLVAATLLGFGTGAVLYLIAWLIIPEES